MLCSAGEKTNRIRRSRIRGLSEEETNKDNAEKGEGREERRPQKAYKDNQKPRSKPTHGEDGGSKRPRGKKPRPQDQRTPSRMEAKPQGKPASIDPDSPFAVLAKFKNR